MEKEALREQYFDEMCKIRNIDLVSDERTIKIMELAKKRKWIIKVRRLNLDKCDYVYEEI